MKTIFSRDFSWIEAENFVYSIALVQLQKPKSLLLGLQGSFKDIKTNKLAWGRKKKFL
jgi:hypothetical protein